MGLDYKQAGVDKEAGYQEVALIKKIVKDTYTSNVLTDLGGFSALFALGLQGMEAPVLVSGTDGVGTKLMIAQALDCHQTVGIDLVAMCVNDILCQGARPLFFLDYIATGRLVPEKMAALVQGVADGCKQAGAALIGGETAEMPGMYGEEDYDLAGFAVGLVDQAKIINGQRIQAGDIAIGLKSSGIHSNGFSLVRAIVEKANLSYTDPFGKTSLGQALLTPTKIYAKPILALLEKVPVKGLAHITGGGLYENLPRLFPAGLGLEIRAEDLDIPPIFRFLQEKGGIAPEEMFHTFNMGVGMVAVVAREDLDQALEALAAEGEDAFVLGPIQRLDQGVTVNV